MKKKGLRKKKRSKWEEWTHWMNLWYQNAYFYSSHQECKHFFFRFFFSIFFSTFLFLFLFLFFCFFFESNKRNEPCTIEFKHNACWSNWETLIQGRKSNKIYPYNESKKISLNWGSKRRKMVKSTERIRWVMVKAKTKVANKGLRVEKKKYENRKMEYGLPLSF